MYLIKRNDGKFVAQSGSEHSYTNRLDLARVYKTKDEATKDLCTGNETIVEIPQLFK